MTKTLRAGAGVLVVLTALGLSGCANPIEQLVQQGVERAIEGAIEGGSGGSVDINTGSGASLPDGWPSEVPTPNGEVQLSIAVDKGFMVTYLVDEADVERALQGLTAAGFAEEGNIEASGTRIVNLRNANWTIGLTITQDSDSGKRMMAYIVAPV